MGSIVQLLLLSVLVNCEFVRLLALDSHSTPEELQLSRPNSEGVLKLRREELDVYSLQSVSSSLTNLDLTYVNILWNDSKPFPVYLKNLKELKMMWCEVNPNSIIFSQSMTILKLGNTKLINGSLGDLLKTANHLTHLKLTDMGIVDISKLLFRSASPTFQNFGETLVSLEIEGTKFMTGVLHDLLNRATKMRTLSIGSRSDDLDVSKLNTKKSKSGTQKLFGNSLKDLTIFDTRIICGSLCDLLHNARNLENLELGHIYQLNISDSLVLQSDFILEKLVTFVIVETTFVNGSLYDLLKKMINLHTLTIDSMGFVDFSILHFNQLESLEFTNLTLTSSRPSHVRFEKLLKLHTLNSKVKEDDPSLFLNADKMFPNIEEINTGSKIILRPKILIPLLNSSATTLTFSFDFDPPVKTFEFGEVMKILDGAGYSHGEYSNEYIEKYRDGLSAVQRVHLIALHRAELSDGVYTRWHLLSDHTSDGSYSGTTDVTKPIETKAIIYIYFVILLLIIGIGTTGNILSGIAVFRTKLRGSVSFILFALMFYDTGVILTYLVSAYFNAEIFYRMFVQTTSKSTVYTVDEHLWLTKQNSIVAFLVYPLNKTVYTGSVYTTVLISLERFIAICWPLKSKYLLNRQNSKRAILTVLAFSVLLNIPRWIESYEWNTYSEDSPNWNEFYKPTLMRMESYRTIYHGWVWVTFMYILPFILVAFFNFRILRQMNLSQQIRRSLLGLSARSENENKDKDSAEVTALTKMLLCVVGVFVACNSVHIAIVFYFLTVYDQIQLSTAEAVSCLPIVINCSVNFLIYVFLVMSLRAEFVKLLPTSIIRCCTDRKDELTNSAIN